MTSVSCKCPMLSQELIKFVAELCFNLCFRGVVYHKQPKCTVQHQPFSVI